MANVILSLISSSRTDIDSMKYLLGLIILASIAFIGYANADTPSVIGSVLLPSKIMENTNGIIEVYSKTDGVMIDKLVATSSDPTIVQIQDITQDQSHSISYVKIKAVKAGDAKIALAAPGFSSNEFDVLVLKNANVATKLMIKSVPNTFVSSGPKNGYVGIETVNDNDIPTPVTEDTQISISTSDSNVVNPITSNIVIKKGSYHTTGQFFVGQPGTVTLSASSPSMQAVSTTVTVTSDITQNTLQVYVFPKIVNAYQATTAYVIVQLHDASNNPIIAKNDTPVSIKITNTNSTNAINTSEETNPLQVNGPLILKKDSYWAYVPIQVSSATTGIYNVEISAKGAVVSAPAQINVTNANAVMNHKSARLDILPILATGKNELIGVMHLEDSSGNTLLSDTNLKIHVDSSDTSIVSVPDVQMSYGSQSALVFAQIGNSADPVTLNVDTENAKPVTPVMTLLNTEAITLKADSLIPKVLQDTTFPMIFYMAKGDALTNLTTDFSMLLSPDNIVQTSQLSMQKGQPIKIVDATLIKSGMQSLSVTAPTSSYSFTVDGVSTSPKSVSIDHPDVIMSGINNTFSIELLNDQQMPLYVDHDITVNLVSSDPKVVDLPASVQIPKGSYFTTFTVQAKNEGQSEIAVLGDEVPLSKFNVNISSLVPEVSIQSPDFGATHAPLNVNVVAIYHKVPLRDLHVEWTVDDGNIQQMDKVTDSNGIAKISVISNDAGTLHISASVSGGLYQTATASKDITINAPLSANTSSQLPQGATQSTFTIFGINPFMIVLPIAGGIGFIIFKKKDMLSSMMEQSGLGEKFSEIKDKVSGLGKK
jgi:hypothetical protein